MLICTLLSIPSYIFFYYGNASSSGEDSSIKFVLTQFSLGNVGESGDTCNYGQQEVPIPLACTMGELESITTFGVGVNDKQDCESIKFKDGCSIDDLDDAQTTALYNAFNDQCVGLTECSFTATADMIPSQCQGAAETLYIKGLCVSSVIDVPYYEAEVQKENAALLVVLCDLLIGIVLVLAFSCLKFCQDFEDTEIIDQTMSADDFSVEIKNLPKHDNVKDLKAFLWHWIEKNL